MTRTVNQLRPGHVVTALPYQPDPWEMGARQLPVTVLRVVRGRRAGHRVIEGRDATGRLVSINAGRYSNKVQVRRGTAAAAPSTPRACGRCRQTVLAAGQAVTVNAAGLCHVCAALLAADVSKARAARRPVPTALDNFFNQPAVKQFRRSLRAA